MQNALMRLAVLVRQFDRTPEEADAAQHRLSALPLPVGKEFIVGDEPPLFESEPDSLTRKARKKGTALGRKCSISNQSDLPIGRV
jgi:hypothetical protein